MTSKSTLQNKLEFCQLMLPKIEFGTRDNGYGKDEVIQITNNGNWYPHEPKQGFKVTDERIESLCMRWLIENQERQTKIIRERKYGGGSMNVQEYFLWGKLNIDSIISLALKMNKKENNK